MGGAPTFLVGLAVSVALLLFGPWEWSAKLTSAAFTVAVAFLASLVSLLRRSPKQTRGELFAEALSRAKHGLPSDSRIDWYRPLLAAGVTRNQSKVVGLILQMTSVDGAYMVVYVRERGRPPAPEVFHDRVRLKDELAASSLTVLPQSDFTDAVTLILFGTDWRGA